MIDMNQLPDDVDRLKQLVLERDATLAEVSLALREAQSRFHQLALLLEAARQMQLPEEGHAHGASFVLAGSARPQITPNFAGSDCTCPQCRTQS